jgi:hypothetical protein
MAKFKEITSQKVWDRTPQSERIDYINALLKDVARRGKEKRLASKMNK